MVISYVALIQVKYGTSPDWLCCQSCYPGFKFLLIHFYTKMTHLNTKYTQKQVSIFPNSVLLQPHEILHFVPNAHDYPLFWICLKSHFSVPNVFLTSPRGRIRQMVYIWWHLCLVYHFLLAPLCALSLTCVSYINKFICDENELPSSPLREIATSYLLREAELPPSQWKL